ncbi:hypothetical protein OBBRIDRAFT_108119 [Obba rivulosa]|uniref:Uncharacterized protein n=1 Tax=Obba rivulosa TaxID=1052685 RepID=A0A8E2ANW1_9APHY|nr:hypothetical protein OBBRIDRAFT_108119 [Obba rivulosa]
MFRPTDSEYSASTASPRHPLYRLPNEMPMMRRQSDGIPMHDFQQSYASMHNLDMGPTQFHTTGMGHEILAPPADVLAPMQYRLDTRYNTLRDAPYAEHRQLSNAATRGNPMLGVASALNGIQEWTTTSTSSYATHATSVPVASGYSHMAGPSQWNDAMTDDEMRYRYPAPVYIDIPEYVQDEPAVGTSSHQDQNSSIPNTAGGASQGTFHTAHLRPSHSEHPSAAEASLLLDEDVRPIAHRRVNVRYSMSLGCKSPSRR